MFLSSAGWQSAGWTLDSNASACRSLIKAAERGLNKCRLAAQLLHTVACSIELDFR